MSGDDGEYDMLFMEKYPELDDPASNVSCVDCVVGRRMSTGCEGPFPLSTPFTIRSDISRRMVGSDRYAKRFEVDREKCEMLGLTRLDVEREADSSSGVAAPTGPS